MRSLRAEISLGTAGLQKGVTDAKRILSGLQSQISLQGKDLFKVTGTESIKGNLWAVKKAYDAIGVAQAALTTKRNALMAPIVAAIEAAGLLEKRKAALQAGVMGGGGPVRGSSG